MSDYLASLIRTGIPAGVGALLAWAAAKGFDIPEADRTEIIAALTAAATTIYYAVIRAAENTWPVVGRLLGTSRQPEYSAPLKLDSDLD